VEVGDERKDLLWRRFDARRTLNTESVGPGRGEGENGGDENDDGDRDDLEHR
jgi:hypothetical protein